MRKILFGLQELLLKSPKHKEAYKKWNPNIVPCGCSCCFLNHCERDGLIIPEEFVNRFFIIQELNKLGVLL